VAAPRAATIVRLIADWPHQAAHLTWGLDSASPVPTGGIVTFLEVGMNRQSLFALAAGLMMLAGAAVPASSFEAPSVTTPMARDNLAVYFVHGTGSGATAPLTLDQALASGAVRIDESSRRPITIENLSSTSIFIPAGTLLLGGLQDQVVASTMILPPGSGRTPLDVFCVDPFRTAARGSEDPTVFSSTGVLFPWRTARLALFAGSAENKAAETLRQSAIWWSIDTLRSQLARVLGEPLEPRQPVTWMHDPTREARSETLLRQRQSPWRTSLPLALQSPALAERLQSYLDLGATEAAAPDVIGVVFAINGRIEGAEIYQSHELFGHLWPSLLRAYATQALAASDAPAEILPPLSVVETSLAAAQSAAQRTPDSVVRETDDMLFTETRAGDGSWIASSFVPKLTQAAETPDALAVSILQSGEVAGRTLASLGDGEVVLARDETTGHWSATASPTVEALTRFLREQGEWRTPTRTDSSWSPLMMAASGIWLLLVLLDRGAALVRAAGRAMRRVTRQFGRALVATATRTEEHVSAAVVATAIAAIGALRLALRLAARAPAAWRRGMSPTMTSQA
jgi:hypothetical protein